MLIFLLTFQMSCDKITFVPNVRVQFNGRIPAFQAGCVGSIPITRSIFFICACSSVGQSNCLLSSGSGVRIPPSVPFFYIFEIIRWDWCSWPSTSDCGSEDHGFESHIPPHFFGIQPSGKATDFDSVIALVRIQLSQPYRICAKAHILFCYIQIGESVLTVYRFRQTLINGESTEYDKHTRCSIICIRFNESKSFTR